MNTGIRVVYTFLLLGIVKESASVCRDLYSDLCGYNGDEYNATETEGSNDDNICVCSEVTFCSLVELSEQCKSATVLISIYGNITASAQLHCDISALDSQTETTVYEVSNRTEHEFRVRVSTKSDFGRFKVVCDAFEVLDGISPTNETPWDIVGVNPSEIMVGSQVQLQLTVTGVSETNSNGTWCFLKNPDDSTEIVTTVWISDTQIGCNGFSPAIPGMFLISLGSYMSSSIFDKAIMVKVTSKHPTALTAEYSSDFEKIFINFDENIELQSSCAVVFPEASHQYFGVGFDCNVRGNILVVKMGRHFKILNEISITPNSKICQAGCRNSEGCLTAQPVRLNVSKPKVSGPTLSFYMTAACAENSTEKYMIVKVVPSKRFVPENQISPLKNSGKGQRRNLIMWRTMRRFQSKLSSRRVIMQMDSTDVQPALESLTELDNALDAEDALGSTSTVSVVVQSSPGASSLVAEAAVGVCEGWNKPFRYEWFVNGRKVFEDGRMLVLKDLPSGKYITKCVVVGLDSGDVLGQGWTTTEILPDKEKLLITPSEISAGKTDDISLRVDTWHGNSVSWTCRTNSDQPCSTPNGKLISDIINLNTQNVSIPAGTLPVGIYTWTAESSGMSTNAKVFIKDGNVTAVGVEIPSVFVKPEEFVLQGTIRRVQSGCRVWWSSVRQKGFNYLPLKTAVVEVEASVNFPVHVPLVIPDWKSAEPDTHYLFQLQVFCPHSLNFQGGSFDYLKVPLVVSNPPRVSPPTVSPLTGEAMVTEFSISGTEAEAPADHHPLVYEWSYVNPCNVEVPIGRGSFVRNFTTFLPPGDVKVMVKVCNGRNVCGMAESPMVSVIQGSDFPAENFRRTRTQIRYLMKTGDIMEAFGLATTSFKSLAFLSEREPREELLTTVEEVIKDRINHLMRSDAKNLNACLDFFEKAVAVAKYFRKGSEILNVLTEFRDGVVKSLNSG